MCNDSLNIKVEIPVYISHPHPTGSHKEPRLASISRLSFLNLPSAEITNVCYQNQLHYF